MSETDRCELPRPVRWVLLLYPASFRREFGDGIAEVLARRAHELPPGRRIRSWFWFREIAALLLGALREHVSILRARLTGRGDVPTTKRGVLMEQVFREVRFAFRRLLLTPVFGIGAVLTLALALGANTAIFTLIQRVLLAPLPYPESERLVLLDHGAPRLNMPAALGISESLFLEYDREIDELEQIALYQSAAISVRTASGAEEVRYTRASPSLADVLRLRPRLGRWLTNADLGQSVVVLSHEGWQRLFGGDRNVIGKTIIVAGWPCEVIGVMPPEFAFPDRKSEFWMPYIVPPANVNNSFNGQGAVARLSANQTIEELQERIKQVIARASTRPEMSGLTEAGVVGLPLSLKDHTVGPIERRLWIVFAATGLVLVIAFANVANLFLVRADTRQRDLAVRRALGAGRRGIALYFLSEGVLLGLVAGAIGWMFALASLRLLLRFGPELPRAAEIHADASVFGFIVVFSLLSGLALGIIPLLRRRTSLSVPLQDASRGNTGGPRRTFARNVMGAGQLGIALVLMVAAGLMVRSFDRLRRTDPGFDATSPALIYRVAPHWNDYQEADNVEAFHLELQRRLRALPGVRSLSATSCFPLGETCWGDDLTVQGRPKTSSELQTVVWHRRVASNFFATMGSRIRRGRDFTPAEQTTGAPVVIINQALADQFFPGEDPIGRHLYPGSSAPKTMVWLTVVGVVANMATTRLGEESPQAQLYMPLTVSLDQHWTYARSLTYVLRTAGEPLALLPQVRKTVATMNSNVPVARAASLRDIIDRASAQLAFMTALLATAAAVAISLGVIGVYSVISYSVSQRTGEVGVRIALGATRGQVLRMIVAQGSLVIGTGIVLGLAAAVAVSGLLESLLFATSRLDPLTYLVVVAILSAVAMIACYLPARRAARIDPASAMRAT
jgi:putative ABC transport system permease protein